MMGQPQKTHMEILFIQNVERACQKSRVGLGCGLVMDLACTLQHRPKTLCGLRACLHSGS